MSDQTSQDNQTLSVSYLLLEGFRESAYYVDAIIRSGNGESMPIKMEIDTGASITCVPQELLEGKATLYGQPVVLTDYAGRRRRQKTYKVDILLLDEGVPVISVRPFRGVISRKNMGHGLLGMDVLKDYEILLHSSGGLMAKVGGGV